MHESRQDTAVALPNSRPTGVLTDKAAASVAASLTALLARFPVAVLGRER